jgi:hypothetical protein
MREEEDQGGAGKKILRPVQALKLNGRRDHEIVNLVGRITGRLSKWERGY